MPATSLTRITQARQPSLARRRRSQLPTEVLDIIFAHLTQRDLLAVSYVCKTWRPSACHQLWKNIDTLPLNSDFLQLLPTHGHLIHRLDLILHAQSRLEGEPDDLLAQVLQDTPRLQHLCIYLLGYESDEFLQPSFAAISTYVGGSLTSLGLKGMTYAMENEAAAREFFLSLSRLTRFEIDGQVFEDVSLILDSLPLLTAIAFKGDRVRSRRTGVLTNLSLQLIGTKLPLLRELTVHFNETINGEGLKNFSTSCPRLTRVDLRGCRGMQAHDLTNFLSIQPHLTHVSLADTNLNDGGLLILAAPARAVKLRTLNIRKCRFVQARGIGQVVMACTNLQELNISLCSGVWLDIFSFAWACLGLLRLNIGGIHGPVPTQDGSDNYVNRIVREEEVVNMYTQLGRLHLLEELTLLPLPCRIHLFELGRTSIENMTRLEYISVVGRLSALSDRDIIWLATRLPSLRTLDLDQLATRVSLLHDLADINRSLKIRLCASRDHYGILDLYSEDNDAGFIDETDNDETDNDETDNDETDNDETDNDETDGVETDSDETDSDDDGNSDGNNNNNNNNNPFPNYDDNDNYAYYSPGEEPYQPAHLGVYEDNDDDDDGANIYPSASTPSNSDVYESYDEELDNSDDSTGYYWWGYRDPYSVTTDSDESGPYYDHGSDDDSQDNSEQDSEEDDSEEDGSGSGSEDDGSDGSDDNSQDNSEQDSEEENSEENGSGSGSEDDDSDRQSELSSLAESDSDEDEGQDDNGQIESEVSSEAGSSGDDDDDDHNLNGGEVSDEELSDEDEEEDVDSDAGSVEEDDEIEEEVEEEEEQEEDEEEQVEQYSEEEAEEEAEEHYSDGQDEAEEAEYSEEYDEDQYGDYDDDDSGDSEDQESNGGYSSDDY